MDNRTAFMGSLLVLVMWLMDALAGALGRGLALALYGFALNGGNMATGAGATGLRRKALLIQVMGFFILVLRFGVAA
jgi:hypothetical protein